MAVILKIIFVAVVVTVMVGVVIAAPLGTQDETPDPQPLHTQSETPDTVNGTSVTLIEPLRWN